MIFVGLIVLLIAPFYIYRTAKQNGHNALFWTLLAIVAGVCLQVILPVLTGMLLASLMTSAGRSINDTGESMGNYSFFIGMLSLALSLTAFLLISQYVSKIKSKNFHAESSPSSPPKSSDF